ncbi:MAG: hypothetical protein C0167_03045 [Nitrososphaera sp.]|nr:MAG: hypothetical protein C0167_03045 [Nitrososphaera sp.]
MSSLNPRKLIADVRAWCQGADEILLRRCVSALYFSLYNYWAELRLRRGRLECNDAMNGSLKDDFPHSGFVADMLRRGLNDDIMLLFELRVLADHHVCNPGLVEIHDKELSRLIKQTRVELNAGEFERALESAGRILSSLEAG